MSENGTWLRLLDGSAEGRVVRGYKGLAVGMKVPVRLINTDSVHGFIDFEHGAAIDSAKEERTNRKRAAALELQERIGESFSATVTGVTSKATWITAEPGHIEGRLVRGYKGLRPGDAVSVVLLTADPARGFIDFARDEDPGGPTAASG